MPPYNKPRSSTVTFNAPPKPHVPLIGTPQQQAIWDAIATDPRNLVVVARAGTGKTTTMVEGCYYIPAGQTICCTAFNKSIAVELGERLPQHVTSSTMHSLGAKIVGARVGRYQVNKDKTWDMLDDNLPMQVRSIIVRIVSLCKNLLLDGSDWDELDELCVNFSIDIDNASIRQEIFSQISQLLDNSLALTSEIDFDDMLWLPVMWTNDPSYSTPKQFVFDRLFVDEGQDLNPVQQRMVFLIGRWKCVVGDDRQAIYGFRGADHNSLNTMIDLLMDTDEGCLVLPLTQTRRCPTSVVELAQTIVPDFESLPDAPVGFICDPEHCTIDPDSATIGTMILCRVNAPLVSLAYSFIRNSTPVKIQGRDIGDGITKKLKRVCNNNTALPIEEVCSKMQQERTKESDRILKLYGKKPMVLESKMQQLDDQYQCIDALCGIPTLTTLADLITHIGNLFADVKSADASKFVLLSSVHRAKGLESSKVMIIESKLMPHPMAKTTAQVKQEYNLMYVAWTRSKNELHIH